MFDIGGGELILIVLAILVLFGPKKIPEIAQMFGKGMRKFKEAQSQFQNELNIVTKDVSRPIEVVKEKVQTELNRSAKNLDISNDLNISNELDISSNIKKSSSDKNI